MINQKCVICGESFNGLGNNPQPIAEGICCDNCNSTKVIPKRLNQLSIGDLE